MKKLFIIAVLVVLVVTPAMAALTVAGSKHDMIASGFATAGGNTEVCVFCHTPHGAQVSVTQAPLWNNLAVANVVGFYNSATTNFPSTSNLIDATDARLCLACHDGGVGLTLTNASSGGQPEAGGTAMSANTLLSTNMSNDHPIGMDLGVTSEINPVVGGDSGIRSIAVIKGNFGGVDPFFGGAPDDNINIMWCSSCHDVHDSDPLKKPFLRMNNSGSAMCKACHIK